MEEDQIFELLIDEVLFPYYYDRFYEISPISKYSLLVTSKGVVTEDFALLIIKAIYIQSKIYLTKWLPFLHKVSDSMLSSPQTYVKYVTCICKAALNFTTDIYDQFISVCTLVIKIGDIACTGNCLVFFKLTPYILKVIFKKILKEKFRTRGGWQCLERYLQNNRHIRQWDERLRSASASERRRLKEKLSYYIEEKTKALKYNPLDIILETLHDPLIADITKEVILSVELSLFVEIKSSLVKKKKSTAILNGTTLSNSVFETILPSSEQFEKYPEPETASNEYESEKNINESNLLKLKTLMDESDSVVEVSNLPNLNNKALEEVTRTIDQLELKIEYLISVFESLDVS
ncbi:hypothetical protein TNIN_138851 [Trichonephila inaurata madagascariensis]|uniref:Uncharacterized protein n=1 Tax=Trichonephila inaurata madagascariensis TaxID=2747483 RepID=A0A8X6YC89_9ARAC|nr:hypothetical protein TNIN_138851 [Trichonephila inaurata madagascariensis]